MGIEQYKALAYEITRIFEMRFNGNEVHLGVKFSCDETWLPRHLGLAWIKPSSNEI